MDTWAGARIFPAPLLLPDTNPRCCEIFSPCHPWKWWNARPRVYLMCSLVLHSPPLEVKSGLRPHPWITGCGGVDGTFSSSQGDPSADFPVVLGIYSRAGARILFLAPLLLPDSVFRYRSASSNSPLEGFIILRPRGYFMSSLFLLNCREAPPERNAVNLFD